MTNELEAVLAKDKAGNPVRVGSVIRNVEYDKGEILCRVLRADGFDQFGVILECEPIKGPVGRAHNIKESWRVCAGTRDVDGKVLRVGDRVVLTGGPAYDECHGTIIEIHNENSVQVRYDRGSGSGAAGLPQVSGGLRLCTVEEVKNCLDAFGHAIRVGSRVAWRDESLNVRKIEPIGAYYSGIGRQTPEGCTHMLWTHETQGWIGNQDVRVLEDPEQPTAEPEVIQPIVCAECKVVLQKAVPDGPGNGHFTTPEDKDVCIYCLHRLTEKTISLKVTPPSNEYEDSDRCSARADWEWP